MAEISVTLSNTEVFFGTISGEDGLENLERDLDNVMFTFLTFDVGGKRRLVNKSHIVDIYVLEE